MRASAALALGRIGPEASSATSALITALLDSDPAVRIQAARALGRIGPGASPAIDALVSALSDDLIALRICAAEALGRMGESAQAAVPALVAALNNDHSGMRRPWCGTAQHQARLGGAVQHGSAIGQVIACSLCCSAHRFRVIRRRPYLAIFSVLLISGAITLVLIRPARHSMARGQSVSTWALALAGPAPTERAKEVIKSFGPEAVPDLIRMLRTKDSILSRPLQAIGPKLTGRVNARLRRIFKIDETFQRRYTAAMALGLMGTNAKAALPALLEALRDPSMSVSATAALDLAGLGTASLPGRSQRSTIPASLLDALP
jgi:HEAT repeat protein